MFGCVSGPDYGAMGLHYVNLDLVGDGELDRAEDQNFARREGVPFDPFFFRDGEAIEPGAYEVGR